MGPPTIYGSTIITDFQQAEFNRNMCNFWIEKQNVNLNFVGFIGYL